MSEQNYKNEKPALRTTFFLGAVVAVFLFLSVNVHAQSAKGSSLAFRKQSFGWQYYPLYIPEYSYQFLESFYLVQKANNDDPQAQQELSIRFLTGEGFPADTARAIYWMKRAADNQLPAAKYNLGIFYLNGIGLPWNPFTAYKSIHEAALLGMPEAEFLLGVFSTEDLIVPRNYDTALVWISKAAASSFKPAIEAQKKLEKIIERKKESLTKSKQVQYYQSQNDKQSISGADIDFMDDITKDEGKKAAPIPDSIRLKNLLADSPPDLRSAMGFSATDSLPTFSVDSLLARVQQAADCGSPEANIFFGRCCESGVLTKQSIIQAAAFYLHAFRLESPEGGYYLSKILERTDFNALLDKAVARKDIDAYYVYALLQSDNATDQSFRTKLLTLLKDAAAKGMIAAQLELGEIYFKGKYAPRDTAIGFGYWREAAAAGSKEADLRIALANLFLKKDCAQLPSLETLDQLSARGAILALLIEGYIFENGICNPVDRSKAVEYYRKAAFRGNSTAYLSLKRLYSELRPVGPTFKIPEE